MTYDQAAHLAQARSRDGTTWYVIEHDESDECRYEVVSYWISFYGGYPVAEYWDGELQEGGK